MVPITTVHPTMVGGLNDLVVLVPKNALGGYDMSVVSWAPSVGKCSPSKGENSSRFTILCLVDIGLVIRLNEHYIHASLLQGFA